VKIDFKILRFLFFVLFFAFSIGIFFNGKEQREKYMVTIGIFILFISIIWLFFKIINYLIVFFLKKKKNNPMD